MGSRLFRIPLQIKIIGLILFLMGIVIISLTAVFSYMKSKQIHVACEYVKKGSLLLGQCARQNGENERMETGLRKNEWQNFYKNSSQTEDYLKQQKNQYEQLVKEIGLSDR